MTYLVIESFFNCPSLSASDVNQVDSEFWAKNLPDNGEKVCAAFDVSSGYTLNNFNCYSVYGLLCEYNVAAGAACPSGFGQYGSTCFQLVDSEASLRTWYAARQYCQSRGYKLMTVKTIEKLTVLQVFLKANVASVNTKAWVWL